MIDYKNIQSKTAVTNFDNKSIKIKVILILLFFFLPNIIYGNKWYVSTSSSGNGNGSSWANKRILSNFNWTQVQPGDTVFVDGGVDSLVYNYTSTYYSFYPNCNGTINNKIVIARGTDAGHTGRPVFMGSSEKPAAYITTFGSNYRQYLEINNLVFRDGNINGGTLVLAKTEGIDIINCEIWHPITSGVSVDGNNTRIIRNKIRTGIVSNDYGTDAIHIEGGGISVGYKNIEIAYNYILSQNGGGSGHKDIIQTAGYWQKAGGVTKIHHNFLAHLPGIASTNMGGIYIDDSGGHYEIYNNIIIMNPIDASNLIGIYDPYSLGLYVKVYNNTMYSNATDVFPAKYFGLDSLDVRNNIIYAPNAWIATGLDYTTVHNAANLNFNNNTYYCAHANNFAYMFEPWIGYPGGDAAIYTWNQWKTLCGEANSKFEAVTFEGGNNTLAASYKLASGSNGINDGVHLILLSDDYEGTIRPQGVSWDVGAFEFVETSLGNFQLVVEINDDWNMVSVPGLHPTNQNVTTWWPGKDPAASVFKFVGGFQSVTTITPGEGYWMKHIGARTYNTGDEWPANGILTVPHSALNRNAGWSLIGGYEHNAAVSGITTTPLGLQDSPVFGYSNGYQIVNFLIPGYGYWIKLSGAGSINLPNAFAKVTSALADYIKDDWGKIIITDSKGKQYTLYAVKGEVNLKNYELPPVPPAEMFDIRFGSGRLVEDLSSGNQSIQMQGLEYPITVRVEDIGIRIQDAAGSVLNERLKSGEEVVISNSAVSKLMVSSEIIPELFSLEQNYPNPFNSLSSIKYSIPKSSQVTLKIFNTLGEEIATLVNEEKLAGTYELKWNASNLPSGVYFYNLQAGIFFQTRKMILLK